MFMILPTIIATGEKHFGLSIGRGSLRAVEVDKRGNVQKIAEVLIPADVFQQGVLQNKEVFVQSIKKLLEISKITTKYVAVCFSEAHAYSREYSIPLIHQEEVSEAISWHLKDLFPFPPDEIYYDWKLAETTATEHKIIVTAVQKQMIDPLVDAFISLGLKPLSFEPGASVISKLLKFNKDQKTLITEINRGGAYVTLVEENKSRFTTVINYTAEDTPETYIANIAQTIQELSHYYLVRKIVPSEIVDVILTGELASDAMIKQLSVTVKNPLRILITPVANPAFNKAYSMAVSHIMPPQDIQTINVLPPEIQSRYDAQRNHDFYMSLLGRLLVFTLILMSVSLTAFMTVTINRQQLDKKVKTLSNYVKTQKPDTQKVLTLNATAQQVVNLAPLRTTPKEKILILASILPDAIVIDSWSFEDSKQLFMLNGKAQNRDALLSFKQKLEMTGEFAKINLPLESLVSENDIDFSLSFITKK